MHTDSTDEEANSTRRYFLAVAFFILLVLVATLTIVCYCWCKPEKEKQLEGDDDDDDVQTDSVVSTKAYWKETAHQRKKHT